MQMQFDTLEIWPFYRYNKQIEIWRLMMYSRTQLYRTARDRPFLWVITRICYKRVNLCTKMTRYFKTLCIFFKKDYFLIVSILIYKTLDFKLSLLQEMHWKQHTINTRRLFTMFKMTQGKARCLKKRGEDIN